MRKYQKSDYAANKYKNEIVYLFVDGTVEISMADYLRDNPQKTEEDFWELKELSDSIYHEQDLEETRYAKRKIRLGKLEESEKFAKPSPYIELMEKYDNENALESALQLIEAGNLTEVQKRRFALHFFHGISYRQIARMEHVDYTSVRESMHSAIKKLKRIFEKK